MKRKGDIEIGQRAFAEASKMFGGPSKAAKRLRLGRTTVFSWNSGDGTPSAYALQAMAFNGIDVLYVLTGRRTNG